MARALERADHLDRHGTQQLDLSRVRCGATRIACVRPFSRQREAGYRLREPARDTIFSDTYRRTWVGQKAGEANAEDKAKDKQETKADGD